MKLKMEKSILVMALSAVAISANAESKIKGELLVGNSDHKASYSGSGPFGGQGIYKNSSKSYGFRFSYDVNSYFSAEISYYDYGENKSFIYDIAVDDLVLDQASSNYSEELDITMLYPSGDVNVGSDRELLAKMRIKSIGFGVIGRLPLSNKLSLLARLGVAKWDMMAETRFTNDVFPPNKSGDDTYYSLGFDYALTEKFSVGLEYSMLTMKWGETYTNSFGDSIGLITDEMDTDFSDITSVSVSNTRSSSTDYELESFSLSLGYRF